jgi:NAD(P)H-hydrate epimerase
VQAVVANGDPAYTTVGILQHSDGTFGAGAAEAVRELAGGASVMALGPGVGRNPGTVAFVRRVLQGFTVIPVVLDADGLFAVSPFTDEFRRSSPIVLTPHPGEFSRLTGELAPETDIDRQTQAMAFARRFGCVLLLKGSGTIVTDGARVYRNMTGNPGMATGGSGDSLTGVIAALIGQGLGAFDAAVLGAWVHGRAGDLAAAVLGQTALTAPDIIDYLPAAFLGLEVD